MLQRGVQNQQYQRYSIIQEGCTNDPGIAVPRFHEKLWNVGKSQYMGAQLSQCHRYFGIPWDPDHTKKIQKQDVQRLKKQQNVDSMRNARI